MKTELQIRCDTDLEQSSFEVEVWYPSVKTAIGYLQSAIKSAKDGITQIMDQYDARK